MSEWGIEGRYSYLLASNNYYSKHTSKAFLSLFWQQRYYFRFAVLTHLNGFSLPEETVRIPASVLLKRPPIESICLSDCSESYFIQSQNRFTRRHHHNSFDKILKRYFIGLSAWLNLHFIPEHDKLCMNTLSNICPFFRCWNLKTESLNSCLLPSLCVNKCSTKVRGDWRVLITMNAVDSWLLLTLFEQKQRGAVFCMLMIAHRSVFPSHQL